MGPLHWYAVANTAEALVVTAFLLRATGHPRRPVHAGRRSSGSSSAPLGGATVATIAATGAQVLGDGTFSLTWRVVAASHATAILVIVPLSTAPRRRLLREVTWEPPAQVTALSVVTLLVFGPTRR